jgi:hypothetical protein
VRIGVAIASSVVRIGAPITKSDAMVATIRPPQWRPYLFLAPAQICELFQTSGAPNGLIAGWSHRPIAAHLYAFAKGGHGSVSVIS